MDILQFLSKHRNTIIIICLILIFYYFILLSCTNKISNELITGFWKCDSEFLMDADLSSFLLYLSPKKNGSKERACYLLAEQDSELILNEPCSANISKDLKLSNWNFWSNSPLKYNIEFKDLEDENFPNKQKMTFYPKIGKLILSKDDVIYGIFYKDSYLTDSIYEIEEIKPDKSTDNNLDESEKIKDIEKNESIETF